MPVRWRHMPVSELYSSAAQSFFVQADGKSRSPQYLLIFICHLAPIRFPSFASILKD
jgi:hypothetical protein